MIRNMFPNSSDTAKRGYCSSRSILNHNLLLNAVILLLLLVSGFLGRVDGKRMLPSETSKIIIPTNHRQRVRNELRGGSVVRRTVLSNNKTFNKYIRKQQKSKVTKQDEKTKTIETEGAGKNKLVLVQQQQRKKAAAVIEHPKEDPKIMLLMRLLFLTYYGSLGSLMPYLPVYYDSIGHGGQVIGLLGAVKPLTTFLVAPAWGILSDQTQKPFLILQVTFLVSLIGQLLVSLRHDTMFLMCMAFVTALFNAPVKSLLDTMVMDQLHDPSVTYGRLRLWGQLGFGLGSSAVGILLSKSHRNVEWADVSPRPWIERTMTHHFPPMIISITEFFDKFWQTMTGYKLLFFVHGALSIPTWMCIQVFQHMNHKQDKKRDEEMNNDQQHKLKSLSNSRQKLDDASKKTKIENNGRADKGYAIKPKKKKSSVSVLDGLKLLISNGDAMLFFFLVFVVGTSSGVIENFAYVRIREVGGTGKAMGLSRLVSSVAGAPMFWFSGPLTEILGADKVIVFSLISYVVRFIIYAAMRNPYHGLPAEALRGITFAAFWSTGTVYAHRVSPPGMHATMLMFLNAMYGGLGQSLGSIIGGKLQHRFGTVKTFLYSAAFDFIFVLIVITYLSLMEGESSFKNPQPIEAPTKKEEIKSK